MEIYVKKIFDFHTYSFLLVSTFQSRFFHINIHFTRIARTAASNAATDVVTNWVIHRIFNTNL